MTNATAPQTETSAAQRAPTLPPEARVEIVGTIPPPYGGVTIHCERLLDHLTRAGITARLWDLGGREDTKQRIHRYEPNELRRAVKPGRPTVIHWHQIPDRRAMGHLFADQWLMGSNRQRTATILSFHNSRIDTQVAAQPIWKQAAIRWFVRRCDAIIFDAQEGRDQGLALGCSPQRCFVIPAFIPPPPESVRPECLPPRVRAFIDAHDPVLAAVGWTIDFVNGTDIYGIDLLVEAMGKLIQKHPSIGLVFRLAQPQQLEYFQRLKERAETLQVARNILWVTEPLESATAIWKASDIFVRPTCTDGDAVSVGEAMHFGVPVVASDAVKRPAGCRTFHNRDVRSLVDAIEETLDDRAPSHHHDSSAPVGSMANHADEIIAVYAQALAGIG
ncbi:MAG TPA: glycosyltransferase family 4 protein [Acidobacteriota bacterium]|nr:glycosyltransferase family 4 protein [Acidobacteriota bacterium]